MATREQIYREQLQALEIYDPAFDPEISTLAQCEREYTRLKKEWSATAARGSKPSFKDPLYAVIQNLRKEILMHREALGLTPKALRKLKANAFETVRAGELAEEPEADVPTMLDIVRQKYAI